MWRWRSHNDHWLARAALWMSQMLSRITAHTSSWRLGQARYWIWTITRGKSHCQRRHLYSLMKMFHTECLNLATNNWSSGGLGLGLLYPLNASRDYFFSFLRKCSLHSINSGELCSQRSQRQQKIVTDSLQLPFHSDPTLCQSFTRCSVKNLMNSP